MRIAIAFLFALGVLVAPPGVSAVEHGSERGQFALAGWASADPRTGEEHWRMIVTSGPLDGPANVEYSGSDTLPITCPDGTAGQRLVEESGLTTGALAVERNLDGASLVASVRVRKVTRTLCQGVSAGPAVTHSRRRLGLDLSGVGGRWTERSGTFMRVPSLQTSHEHARAVGRDATGTLGVGRATYPLVFGDFGRITGTWHWSAHTELAAAALRGILPASAVRAAGAMDTGSLRRAGAVWERYGRHSYRGVSIGADRMRGGESLVYMDGYTSSTSRCADGSSATREVIRWGEGPGKLEVHGHHASAHAAGLLDVTKVVFDGCTGGAATSIRSGVHAKLSLSGTGLTIRSGEWTVLHNPPGPPRRVHVEWSGRSATGSLRVGQQRHPTTWGEIGTLRWREQGASPRAASARYPDFNGDGYADLAIGAPNRPLAEVSTAGGGKTGGEGAVAVLYGSANGLAAEGAQLWTEATPGVPGVPKAMDRFGFRLTTGDFDGDGYADLAAGKPAGLSGGKVLILYGSPRGLTAAGAQLIGQSSTGVPGVAHAGEWFGGALAAGDVDGDGRADLAVGAPSDLVRGRPSGSLTLLYGSRAGLGTDRSELVSFATAGIPGRPRAYDDLATWLAVGDVNGDGFGDVLAGAPGDWVRGQERAGSVLELHGSRTGLRTGSSRLWTQDAAHVGVRSHAWYMFGHRVAIGDLNGDRFGDLVAGAPTQIVGGAITGAATVIYGSQSGLTDEGAQLVSQASPGVKGAAEDPDQFGFGLSIDDLNGDECADLVVGSPGDWVGEVQAGAVNVLFGSRRGLPGRSQLWSQNSPGVAGTSEWGDNFGLDTALGDFDGDGHIDTVVGVGADMVGGLPSGTVLVLPGSPRGPTAHGSRLWTEEDVVPGAAPGEDGFGLAIAATGRTAPSASVRPLGGQISGCVSR